MGYKITAVPSAVPGDGRSFVIADDSLGRDVGSRQLVSRTPIYDAAVQREEYFRGDAPENFNRGQHSCEYELVVCYVFASESAKMAFQDDMQTALPRQANLTIVCDGVQRVIKGAWLRPISTVQDLGTTWIARIHVLGGRVAESIPKVPTGST